jgi:GntR family transcriptional repressor for pyruvate dehydrogenase complex
MPTPSGELNSIYRLMAARIGLEPVAAQEANRRETLEIYAAMKKVEANIHRYLAADDADTNFHQAIIRASHNPYIIGMMLMVDHLIRTHYATFRHQLLHDPIMSQTFLDQHYAIYQAIREHRPEEAADATRTHVDFATVSLATAAGSEEPRPLRRPGIGAANDSNRR